MGDLFALLGQPHMLRILHTFEASHAAPIRFGELQRRLGLSPKTLSDRLRALVEGGFLTRRAYSEIPPRVEYERTAKTVELCGIFEALDAWARHNTVSAVPVVSTIGRVG